MVQWLGLNAFTAGIHVQFPVRELRSHKPCSAPPPKKEKSLDTKEAFKMLAVIVFYHCLLALVAGNADSTFSLAQGSKKQSPLNYGAHQMGCEIFHYMQLPTPQTPS